MAEKSIGHEVVEKMARSIRRRTDTARTRVSSEIERLELVANQAELDHQGYTVLRGVLESDTVGRALEAIERHVARKLGRSVDTQTATADEFEGMNYLPYLLYEDEVFESILLEPKPLALMTYLLGESRLLSSLGCHFKGPGADGELPLHSDNGNGMVEPFPAYSQVANINYALTPYTKEGGALALVPGSHHWARQPSPHEMMLTGETANPDAVAMDLEPGDAVVWHGNTWHGSYPRQIPGIRVNLAVYMCRQYLQTQEHHRGVVPEDLLARHADNETLQILLGSKQPYGWQQEGPDYSVMRMNPKGMFD